MKIGRYTVCGLLGRGGMGAVFKARQPVTDRIVALKVLKPSEMMELLVDRDELITRFETEARIMGKLDHPNIAAIWDYDTAGDTPFFVMEYFCRNLGMVIGESYRVEAPTRKLPLTVAVSYASQTLDALYRMHQAGIVHRDVKPFNLMITGLDEIKLIDFGLSRLRGEMLPTSTAKGERIGSPYYAAPEQEAAPDSVDGRADIFSVGVMLYRMLTGVLPTDEALYTNNVVPRASQYSLDLDSDWDAFFDRAMAFDPAKRFSTAKEMRLALDSLVEVWRERVDNECRFIDEFAETPPCPTDAPVLRSEPVKVRLDNAQKFFGLDSLWRPDCVGMADLVDNEDGTVTDAATGKKWQQSGSEFACTWDEAHTYITVLNEQKFAGFQDWRLPTVDELSSLVQEPPELGAFCVPQLLDSAQDTLWTCDTKSYMAAWFVSASMGFVGWQDMTCQFAVRAVRG
ncbi:DUF1566 domain-containing protein [Halodesulfovibrio sp.]|jgi:serine/threonine-protein kinase|uniref:protein kinase domain-containing protein n=1 Tax=Halodesulfovibrio sp. TaxID=1912772 RepID=UPI0025D7E06B|nr:DUF1566 domain-containing protein [Halodesulfovibrio sp.]MCT4535613.1 DUF1566 domain-containing protein [Halodesulfovibrio sp.]MCT4626599.1 DUF1566 domain-containing protein [Halodesulfovibrio sp.]